MQRDRLDFEALRTAVNYYSRAVPHLAQQQLATERGFEFALNHPPQRARPIDRVVAFFSKVIARAIGQFDLDLALGEALAQAFELDIDDLAQIGLAQRMEDYDLVNAVKEFRPEALAQHRETFFLHLLVVLALERQDD